MKKSCIGLIFIIIVLSFLFIGCGLNNSDNTNVIETNTNPNNVNVVEPNNSNEAAQEVANNTNDKESIQDKLDAQSDIIYAITWSNDNKYVAYISGDPLSMYGQLYIWEVGKEDPETIENLDDRICELIWSPDNQYLLADIGTSVQRSGAIISIIDKIKIADVGYFGNAFWTVDSEYLVIGTISDIQPSVATELSGTVDFASYNIKTGELKIIDKGTSDYYFSPIEVKEDGTIVYKKWYFDYQIEEETFEYKINE